jgi:uncharacterized membrane protein YkoI
MPVSRLCLSFFFPLLIGAAPALAAEHHEHHCLNKAEQRTAVATHRAVPLGAIVKARRAHGQHGELVRARLCHRGDRFIYLLTLLGHSGRVIRVTVDAANGEAIKGR